MPTPALNLSDLQNHISKPRTKGSKQPAYYIPERVEGKGGLLYKKVREEDAHTYRVLSNEEEVREAKKAAEYAALIRARASAGILHPKAWNAPNKSKNSQNHSWEEDDGEEEEPTPRRWVPRPTSARLDSARFTPRTEYSPRGSTTIYAHPQSQSNAKEGEKGRGRRGNQATHEDRTPRSSRAAYSSRPLSASAAATREGNCFSSPSRREMKLEKRVRELQRIVEQLGEKMHMVEGKSSSSSSRSPPVHHSLEETEAARHKASPSTASSHHHMVEVDINLIRQIETLKEKYDQNVALVRQLVQDKEKAEQKAHILTKTLKGHDLLESKAPQMADAFGAIREGGDNSVPQRLMDLAIQQGEEEGEGAEEMVERLAEATEQKRRPSTGRPKRASSSRANSARRTSASSPSPPPPYSARSASTSSRRRSSVGKAGAATEMTCIERMEEYLAKRRAKEQEDIAMKEAEQARAKAEEERRKQRAMNAMPFQSLAEHEKAMAERKKERLAKEAAKLEESLEEVRFRANPVALKGEDWPTLQAKAELERKARVDSRAADLQAMSSLPNRMKVHALEQAAASENPSIATTSSATAKIRGSVFDDVGKGCKQPCPSSSSTQPKIAPERIREVLQRRQKKWEETLKATKEALRMKAAKELVTTQADEIYSRQAEYERKAKERADRKKQKEEEKERDRLKAEKDEKDRLMAMQTPVPKMTNATLKQIARTQEKFEEKRKAEEDEAKYMAEMKAREREVAAVLRPLIRSHEEKSGRLTGSQVSSSAEKININALLKANQAKLDEKLRSRRTLMERCDTEVRIENAKRNSVATIAKIIYKATSGGGNGVATGAGKIVENWKAKARKDDILNDQEKAYLGLDTGAAEQDEAKYEEQFE